MKKAKRVILLLFLLGEPLYFIATAIFLNQGFLLRQINTDPNELEVGYRFAYSVFPGLISVRDLHFRVKDSNMQLYFTIDSARLWVVLPALHERRFVVSSLEGSGLDFRFRFLRSPSETPPELPKLLPSIPGYGDFVKLPPSSGPSHPWRAELRRVSVDHIRQIWIDVVRFTGDAAVQGGFEIRPGEGAGVFPARLVVSQGEVSIRGDRTAHIQRGIIEGKIAAFRKEEVNGLELFRFMSGRVRLNGETDNIRFLNHYVKPVKWLGFEGGGGALHTDFSLDKGRLMPGSRLVVDARQIGVHLWASEARGNAEVTWKVEERGQKPLGELQVLFDDYRLARRAEKDARIEGRNLRLTVTSEELSLTDPFARREVKIVVPEARISRFTFFNSYFPSGSGFRLMGGRGLVHGELTATTSGPDRDRGEVTIEGRNAQARFGKFLIQATVKARILLSHGNVETGKFEIPGSSIRLSEVRGTAEGNALDSRYADWWGNVLLSQGELRLSDPAGFSATVDVRGRDARPVFAVFAARDGLPGWVAKVLAFEDLTAHFGLTVREGLLAFHEGTIKGKDSSLVGWLHKQEEGEEGRLLLRYGPFAVGLRLDETGTHLKLEDAIRWYRERGQEPPP